MSFYKVVGTIGKDGVVYHSVLPYSILGTIHTYFSKDINYGNNGSYGFINRIKAFVDFLENCHLSEKRAKENAKFLDECKDIDW